MRAHALFRRRQPTEQPRESRRRSPEERWRRWGGGAAKVLEESTPTSGGAWDRRSHQRVVGQAPQGERSSLAAARVHEKATLFSLAAAAGLASLQRRLLGPRPSSVRGSEVVRRWPLRARGERRSACRAWASRTSQRRVSRSLRRRHVPRVCIEALSVRAVLLAFDRALARGRRSSACKAAQKVSPPAWRGASDGAAPAAAPRGSIITCTPSLP